jgi:hypothetical protein
MQITSIVLYANHKKLMDTSPLKQVEHRVWLQETKIYPYLFYVNLKKI